MSAAFAEEHTPHAEAPLSWGQCVMCDEFIDGPSNPVASRNLGAATWMHDQCYDAFLEEQYGGVHDDAAGADDTAPVKYFRQLPFYDTSGGAAPSEGAGGRGLLAKKVCFFSHGETRVLSYKVQKIPSEFELDNECIKKLLRTDSFYESFVPSQSTSCGKRNRKQKTPRRAREERIEDS